MRELALLGGVPGRFLALPSCAGISTSSTVSKLFYEFLGCEGPVICCDYLTFSITPFLRATFIPLGGIYYDFATCTDDVDGPNALLIFLFALEEEVAVPGIEFFGPDGNDTVSSVGRLDSAFAVLN